eukprot:Tbor_TRINITY_DN5369_c2_g1::TRINITY_DN5369_c2_g1_i1::g.3945::m.3945
MSNSPLLPKGEDLSLYTSYIQRTSFRYTYILLCFALFLTVRVFFTSHIGLCSTILLTTHNIITFFLLHWIKGQPESNILIEEASEAKTFWEQCEEGYLGTPSRRFLSMFPIILFFITVLLNYNHNCLVTLVFNTITTCVVLVPKLESLFGVRLLGINA